MKILFQIPLNIYDSKLVTDLVPVQRTLTNDHFSVKPMHERKQYSLLCESILYDGADEMKMLSVHCSFLVKVYITRN